MSIVLAIVAAVETGYAVYAVMTGRRLWAFWCVATAVGAFCLFLRAEFGQ